MATFLTQEQEQLAQRIAARLVERGETVAVGEATTGGLVSAALLALPGASRYYAGGAVLYTIGSRTALAGVPPEVYANYRGTTPDMLAALAEALRRRLGATWCIAESGLAGPTGGRFGGAVGSTNLAIAGPVSRAEAIETGIPDRATNMVEFTTRTLAYLDAALQEAPAP